MKSSKKSTAVTKSTVSKPVVVTRGQWSVDVVAFEYRWFLNDELVLIGPSIESFEEDVFSVEAIRRASASESVSRC